MTGSSVILDNNGYAGNAVRFYGWQDAVPYKIDSDFTVEFRARWVGRWYESYLVGIEQENSAWEWGTDGFYGTYWFLDDGVVKYPGSFTPEAGTWHVLKVVKTWDPEEGGSFVCYRDGEEAFTLESDVSYDDNPITDIWLVAGWISTVEVDYIKITWPQMAPNAEAGSDLELIIGENGNFDASSSSDPDGSIASYDWDFGDGSSHGSECSMTHAYASTGTYTVTLVVTDDDGYAASDTLEATVITSSTAIGNLIQAVKEMNLAQGVDNSLDSKLENAKDALDSLKNNDGADAVNKLEAFINEVEAQENKCLSEEQTDILIEWAERIIENI